MDDRFPKYVQFLSRKLGFLAIPNWNLLICGLAVLAFMAQTAMQVPMERFIFDPQRILSDGEWFRLFAFPTEGGSPIFFLFFVLVTYFVVGSLESEWGAAPLTLFILTGYVCAVGAGFLFMQPLSIWNYVLMNTMLAFGTVFPNYEFLLFFILPVKAKYLSMLTGAILLLQVLAGSWPTKGVILLCMVPYILFFGPVLITKIKLRTRRSEFKKKYDKEMWR